MSTTVIISQLYIYPVKSLPGLAVSKLPLDRLGAVDDRRYMLVDEAGKFVSQRQHANLALVNMQEHAEGWLIAFPNGESRVLKREGDMDVPVEVTIWNDTCPAFDQGDKWAEWFSAGLGKSIRLVYTPKEISRRIDPDYCIQDRYVSFVDGYPLMITSESSLAKINQHLEQPITMQRFRPSIVVKGSEAFAEDDWQLLVLSNNKLPNNELSLVKPCARCVIPTINLETAQKEKVVWQILQKLRQAENGKIYFGQNTIHQYEGVLHIGEELSVVRK